MAKFTFQFPQMDIHRAGCADLAKSRNMGETRETVEASDVLAAVTVVIGDPEDESTLAGMGYDSIDHFKVLPCARKAGK